MMGLFTLAIVAACVLAGTPTRASTELTVLGTLDPCDCPAPPLDFDYSDVWGFESNGSEFAVLGTSTGVYIIDVTDPVNPVVASAVAGEVSNWRDVKMFGSFILSVNEAGGGLQVIDASDPYNAVEVASDTQHFLTGHNLYVDESSGRAYIFGADATTSNPILDVSTVTLPVLMGNWSDEYLHDGYVKDNLLFGAKMFDFGTPVGLVIIDVATPGAIPAPTIVTYPDAFTHNTWTTEDGAYCLTTDENPGGHVRIWDVRDLGNITPVSEYSLGPDVTVHNVHVSGDFAYVSYYTEGVRVVDLTDIANPVEAGFYDTTPGEPPGSLTGTWGVYPFLPSGNILASDVVNGLFIFAPVPTSTSVELDPVATPVRRSMIDGIFPNPFNPATTISLRIDGESERLVQLGIYDVRGHRVRNLYEGALAPGAHDITWDGIDDAGHGAASGKYFLRVDSNGNSESQPLVLVK